MDAGLLPETLMSLLKAARPPTVVDVRKRPAFEADPAVLPGALWRDAHAVGQWAAELPSRCPVVVYCVHGHEVSRGVRDALRRRGVAACIIEGGIEGWRAAGGPSRLDARRRRTMKWVTRARPVIDRIACPWLIARFACSPAEVVALFGPARPQRPLPPLQHQRMIRAPGENGLNNVRRQQGQPQDPAQNSLFEMFSASPISLTDV